MFVNCHFLKLLIIKLSFPAHEIDDFRVLIVIVIYSVWCIGFNTGIHYYEMQMCFLLKTKIRFFASLILPRFIGLFLCNQL